MLGLIAVATAIRLAFAWAFGLGVDESYVVAAGRQPQLGYFDHPPLVWWLSRGAAWLFGSEAGPAVRLPFILLFALSTWLMYRIGCALFDRRAGLWAALALSLSPVFSVTSGGWVLPDGPLDCALLGAALCLVRAVPGGRGAWRWWLGAGLCAGLALLAKYTAILVLGGAGTYLLTQPEHRRWLGRPQPYLALLGAGLVFAPVLAWNAAHGWASFAFQGGRASGGGGLRPWAVPVVLAGEALFVLPWIWAGLVLALAQALWRGPRDWRGWLLANLAVWPIAVFAAAALWSRDRVLFHWAAPGYLMLFPLLGAALARWRWRGLVPLTLATAALVVSGVLAAGAQSRWNWLPLVGVTWAADQEAVDWTSLRPALAPWLRDGAVLGTVRWHDAGKLAYAMGPGAAVICLNPDAREFGLVAPLAPWAGHDVLIVAPRLTLTQARAWFGGRFDAIEQLPPASLDHAGLPIMPVPLFLGHRLRP